MLRIIQNSSAAGAQSYYTTSDYYTEGQELEGVWRGEGARLLGLTGKVDRESWNALCDNLRPDSRQPLTLRTKADRRVGYDFNFHVPKSISLLYAVTQDVRLLDAFQSSVNETMQEIETEMKTRVRKDGQNEDRTTSNMVWGEFTHLTSRPIDGVPDPHLHAHCFVFNTTWDKQERAWKACQVADIKRDAPYFEAVFHSKLATRLEALGVTVERIRKGWEVSGFQSATLDRFSRRTAAIEEEAFRKGIVDVAEKAQLGAKTRAHKQKNLSIAELRAGWTDRMTGDELTALASVTNCIGGECVVHEPQSGRAAVEQAVQHVFERRSVVPERILLAESLKRGIGISDRRAVEEAFAQQDLLLVNHDGRRMATTKTVLAEESRMIVFAREGRGTQETLGRGTHVFRREWLNEEQRQAVNHVLQSRDRVILIRGAAGVGKTTMMQEAVEGIEAGGKSVFAFAPSADASRGTLRAEGFDNADTVARLLLDEKLQEQVRGQVLWIDEVGLLGTPTMTRMFDLAEKVDARVILSGDRRQHGSVERGAALRLLETEAGLVPQEIKEIQRQKGDYKQAVQMLSDGRVEEGFREFDRLGWIHELPEGNRHQGIAMDYVAAMEGGKTALVVSPTHAEGERIAAEIRSELKRAGRIGADEREVLTLANLQLTEGERSDAASYQPGHVVEFHQNAKGHRKGDRLAVGEGALPLDQAARFQAYQAGHLRLAAGDLVRITKNGQTLDRQHRLNNGATYRIKRFDSHNNLVLENGWKVARDFGHLTQGYVVTSHASQGKTVDRVFIGQSSDSFGASSREQFYVSASRARELVQIYTDDKEALLAAVSRADDRLAATDLTLPLRELNDRVRRQQQPEPQPVAATRHQQREVLEHER